MFDLVNLQMHLQSHQSSSVVLIKIVRLTGRWPMASVSENSPLLVSPKLRLQLTCTSSQASPHLMNYRYSSFNVTHPVTSLHHWHWQKANLVIRIYFDVPMRRTELCLPYLVNVRNTKSEWAVWASCMPYNPATFPSAQLNIDLYLSE